MSAASSWKIGHRGSGCAGCECGFETGNTVISALYEAPSPEEGADDDESGPAFSRRDWCAECFGDHAEAGTRAAAAGAPFSWWTGTIPEPEPKKPALDLGVAAEFLGRLLKDGAPERASLRYLLSLLLMRKRVVKVVDQFTDERGEVMIVRIGKDEAEHEVVCLEIDEAEAETLRDELGRLFDL